MCGLCVARASPRVGRVSCGTGRSERVHVGVVWWLCGCRAGWGGGGAAAESAALDERLFGGRSREKAQSRENPKMGTLLYQSCNTSLSQTIDMTPHFQLQPPFL